MINIDKIVKLYRKDGITNNLIKLLKIDKSNALNFKLLNQIPDDVKNNIFKTLKYYLLQHLYDNYLDDESIKFYKNLNKSQIDYLIEQIDSPIHKYGESKSKLIEKIAQLLNDKKLPMLSDVRDESTHDVRIVLEPKSRTVDANLLMEHLFKQTELEIRFSMNMNVLDSDGVPEPFFPVPDEPLSLLFPFRVPFPSRQ